jgi:hypothetical protein
MKIAFYAPLAAMLLFVSPQLSAAQAAGPCKADREKLCPGMKPGDGKLNECLKQHEAELSPECAASRKERQDAWKAVRAACKDDFAKFCKDAPKEDGGKRKCLQSHESELGQACADALKAAQGKK